VCSLRVETTDKILRILADGRSRHYSEIERGCRGYSTAVSRALRKLMVRKLVEKSGSGKVGRGQRGEYVITQNGLIFAKSRFANSRLSFWEGRFPLSQLNLFDQYLNPLTSPHNEDRTFAEIRSILAKDPLKTMIPIPEASMFLFSDVFNQQELSSLPISLLNIQWLHSVVDFFINKKKPQVLAGSWPLDSGRLPRDEEEFPREERQRYSRNLTWLKQAHDFKFGAIFTYDGHDWAKKIDWDNLRKQAHQKDLEIDKIFEKLRTPEEGKKFQERLSIERRHQTLIAASKSNDYVRRWASETYNPPVCFKREELHRTVPSLLQPDKALVQSLLEEGFLRIETALVYWLRLTTKGEAELAGLNRESK
jgi:hypothetical protein